MEASDPFVNLGEGVVIAVPPGEEDGSDETAPDPTPPLAVEPPALKPGRLRRIFGR